MELTGETREKFGKSTKAIRDAGFIPAELYGHGAENRHISVTNKEFAKVFRQAGMNTVITLSLAGKKYPVIVHDIQKDHLGNGIRHIDLYQVRMDEKMRVHVPLEFVGEAPAIKAFGGILNKSMSEIEVEALPNEIPHRITIDISSLTEIGKSVYIKNIVFPKGVEPISDPETAVVTVSEAMKEEVVPASSVDVSEVKVESEEKKQERVSKKTEGEEKA